MTLSASTHSISEMTPATSLARPGGPRLAGPLLRTQPDERLATLSGEGSKPAFDELVRRYRGALVGYAGRIAPPDRADDVVQESMVKAFLALRRGDRPELTKAWLFKIVRNTALNDHRDWKPHEHLDENYDGVEQPPEAAERRRQMKELVLALHELPEAQRQAIVQRELEGKGHDEIATALSVSPGAVRQLIFRARGALRAGVGALVPMQLLRWVALAGADPAAPVAAGAGIGLGAAKVGLGAVLATGAVVVGAQVGTDIKNGGDSRAAAAEQSATSQASAGAAEAGSADDLKVTRRPGAAGIKNARVKSADARPLPPPVRPHRGPGRPPPPGGGQQQQQQQTQPGGVAPRPGQHRPPPSGSGTQTAPSGSGTGYPPPPPPPP
jgi:RNA polymerase sigma factor (sigma-70 family)